MSVLERTGWLALLERCNVSTGEAAGGTLTKYSTGHRPPRLPEGLRGFRDNPCAPRSCHFRLGEKACLGPAQPRSRFEFLYGANLLGVLEDLRRSLARPRPRRWAFCGYFIATALLTFPAWLDPTNKWIGGPGDPMKFMEFLSWYPFAISHGLNPLLNSYVNLPGGSNMMWDTTMPLAAVCLWPVTAAFGVIAAWNVGVVAALVLDGWCTFLWLRRHVRHDVAAWIGGLLMVLGPFPRRGLTVI